MSSSSRERTPSIYGSEQSVDDAVFFGSNHEHEGEQNRQRRDGGRARHDTNKSYLLSRAHLYRPSRGIDNPNKDLYLSPTSLLIPFNNGRYVFLKIKTISPDVA
jgi:hypothetical protein